MFLRDRLADTTCAMGLLRRIGVEDVGHRDYLGLPTEDALRIFWNSGNKGEGSSPTPASYIADEIEKAVFA